MHARKALRVAIAIGAPAAIAVVGCFSFGDLSGGTAGAADAAPDVATDAAPVDANSPNDSGPVTYASCAAARAEAPTAPDGFFSITGSDGGAPFQAYCDMTNDDGGWMLVTPDMIANESLQLVTSAHSVDENGGVIIEEYANEDQCGQDGGVSDFSVVTFTNYPPWTQIRSQQNFNGTVSCWSLFGSSMIVPTPNLQAFDPAVDVMYDEVKMGGFDDAGPVDTFSGMLDRCNGDRTNFWDQNVANQRSLIVIQRREIPGPAGLAVRATCLSGAGPGTTATTSWQFRNIYVR